MKTYIRFGFVIFTLLLLFGLNNHYNASRILQADTADPTPRVVKDIESFNGSGFPHNFVEFNGQLYFIAYTQAGFNDNSNAMLWHSDGTIEGTASVVDFRRDDELIYIDWLTVMGENLYMIVMSGEYDNRTYALWKSDGTQEGSSIVLQGGTERIAGASGQRLFFTRTEESTGVELWISDGTTSGTHLVKDINPGPGDGVSSGEYVYIEHLPIVFDDALYFRGYDGTNWALWKADESGTATLLNDILPRNLTVADTIFYFVGGSSRSNAIWKSDGTEIGTIELSASRPPDGLPDTEILQLMTYGDTLYALDRNEWREVHADGTSTVIVDNGYNYRTSQKTIHAFIHDERFYYAGTSNSLDTDSSSGIELWVNNMAETGGRLFKNINQWTWPDDDPDGLYDDSSEPIFLGALGDTIFFVADDGEHGRELWTTDGAEAGTKLLVDINPGLVSSTPSEWGSWRWDYGNFRVIGGLLYFNAFDPVGNHELWRSDGTPSGTFRLTDLVVNDTQSSFPSRLTPLGERLFFIAHTERYGREVWTSDGSEAGTYMLFDRFTEPSIDTVRYNLEMIAVENSVYVLGWRYQRATAWNSRFDLSVELWKIAGEPPQAELVTVLPSADVWRDVSPMHSLNGQIYFDYGGEDEDGTTFSGLWASDGTAEGTRLIEPLEYIDDIVVFDQKLLITANRRLWISDGIEGGTTQISDDFQVRTNVVTMGGLAFFGATSDADGYYGFTQPWVSDGTTSGTTMLKDINLDGQWDSEAFIAGETIVFFTVDGTLWRTNGSRDGTRQINGPTPGFAIRTDYSVEWAAAGNTVYFWAEDTAHGQELWASDGTDAGTRMVMDLSPGEDDSRLGDFTALNNRVYFYQYFDDGGDQLWQTDGTTAGTERVAQFTSDQDAKQCRKGYNWISAVGVKLFFTGCDAVAGHELWVLPDEPVETPTPTPTSTPTSTATPTATTSPEATATPSARIYLPLLEGTK